MRDDDRCENCDRPLSEHTEWCPAPAVHWRSRALAAEARVKALTDEPLLALAEQAIKRMAEAPRLSREEAAKSAAGFIAGETAPPAFLDRDELRDSLAAMTRERDALAATHADVMTVLHQYQPGGSPPAGDVLLAQWTLETLGRELASARALAASNAETMRACSREATELDRQLGASRAREAALREALAELWTWQATVQELPPDDVSERVKAALAKEST